VRRGGDSTRKIKPAAGCRPADRYALEILRVLLLRHAVDAGRRMLANAVERPLERRHVDETRQREDSPSGVSLCSLCYLEEFR
jgi:hypothetical protein